MHCKGGVRRHQAQWRQFMRLGAQRLPKEAIAGCGVAMNHGHIPFHIAAKIFGARANGIDTGQTRLLINALDSLEAERLAGALTGHASHQLVGLIQ